MSQVPTQTQTVATKPKSRAVGIGGLVVISLAVVGWMMFSKASHLPLSVTDLRSRVWWLDDLKATGKANAAGMDVFEHRDVLTGCQYVAVTKSETHPVKQINVAVPARSLDPSLSDIAMLVGVLNYDAAHGTPTTLAGSDEDYRRLRDGMGKAFADDLRAKGTLRVDKAAMESAFAWLRDHCRSSGAVTKIGRTYLVVQESTPQGTLFNIY